jgi:hypothetical protein
MDNLKESQNKWYLKNRERVIEYQKKYRKEKMNNDYNFRMSVVDYQAKYYQNRKLKLKEKKYIDYKPKQRIVNIDIYNTKIII